MVICEHIAVGSDIGRNDKPSPGGKVNWPGSL
jgi:hypothetical protein